MERGERREFDGLHYWKGFFMDGAIITLIGFGWGEPGSGMCPEESLRFHMSKSLLLYQMT